MEIEDAIRSLSDSRLAKLLCTTQREAAALRVRPGDRMGDESETFNAVPRFRWGNAEKSKIEIIENGMDFPAEYARQYGITDLEKEIAPFDPIHALKWEMSGIDAKIEELNRASVDPLRSIRVAEFLRTEPPKSAVVKLCEYDTEVRALEQRREELRKSLSEM